MKVLGSLMSRLGYVPRSSATLESLTFDITIDSASVDAAIAKLEQLQAVADVAEAALSSIAALDQFASAELVADETQPLILAELRKQTTLLEVLAKQGDRVAACAAPATGAAASGLPG